MNQSKLNYAKEVIKKWYDEDNLIFDTAGNNEWLLIYMNRWLGVQQYTEWFIQDRLAKMPYETYRRALQKLIEEGYIKLSDEHMKKRRRVEVETRETLLAQPVKRKVYQDIFDERGRLSGIREVWI